MIRSSRASVLRSTNCSATGSSALVLFGSRARGDAREDSDYDVAVFLKDLTDRWPEIDRIIPVVTDIIDDTGAVIHAMPYRAGAYRDRTSLMREIRREGVDL
jgi:uncharacterized protein